MKRETEGREGSDEAKHIGRHVCARKTTTHYTTERLNKQKRLLRDLSSRKEQLHLLRELYRTVAIHQTRKPDPWEILS